MATLSVLKFDDPNGADRVLLALEGMQERQLITLEDAAVVSWPQANKKPKTRQLHSTASMGAMSGAFWGFLFGLIFFVPFLGAAISARHLRAIRADQRGHRTRQGDRRAQAV
jgi:uncharacterized membrane protein